MFGSRLFLDTGFEEVTAEEEMEEDVGSTVENAVEAVEGVSTWVFVEHEDDEDDKGVVDAIGVAVLEAGNGREEPVADEGLERGPVEGVEGTVAIGRGEKTSC